MCRNIRVLHNFEPPTTEEEIRAAALQYVRKVTGTTKVAERDREAIERAVIEVAEATARVLSAVSTRGAARTREGERQRARERWARRTPPDQPG